MADQGNRTGSVGDAYRAVGHLVLCFVVHHLCNNTGRIADPVFNDFSVSRQCLDVTETAGSTARLPSTKCQQLVACRLIAVVNRVIFTAARTENDDPTEEPRENWRSNGSDHKEDRESVKEPLHA